MSEKMLDGLNETVREMLLSAKTTIAEQSELLKKQASAINELNKYKLAFDVAERMADLDQIDPADFQDRLQTLLEKSAEDLADRAKILSVVDIRKDLDLGVMDDRETKVATDGTLLSPTPHSQDSITAARRLIENTLETG